MNPSAIRIFKNCAMHHEILHPPVRDLETIWTYIKTTLSPIYPRIRFYVCDPVNEKYYGFMSEGMEEAFSDKFNCTRNNPFILRNYPIEFNEVPSDLKNPIEGNEESYLLTTAQIKEWCSKSKACPDSTCKTNNHCPLYVADIFIDFSKRQFIIDQSFTIHIPHPLNKKVPLGALSLDHGKTGHEFSSDECKSLQFIVGTCLGAIAAPLIDSDLKETTKQPPTKPMSASLEKSAPVTLPAYASEYEAPFMKFGMVTSESNETFKKIFEIIDKVASINNTVLITGETGTGKELVARAIHYSGDRKSNPFIPLNCTSFADNLLESELFGHEKGAFSGAIVTKRGQFELADTGTIFLDEIGDMALSLQPKILRVLQESEIQRVGAEQSRKVNVRVIAATNKDLKEEVGQGRFRNDLYYRLNVIPIELPPLRERIMDLLPLVRHFTAKHSSTINRESSVQITAAAWTLISGYKWPGNIRELSNLIERIITLNSSESIIELHHFPVAMQNSNHTIPEGNGILLWPGEETAPESREKSASEIYEELLECNNGTELKKRLSSLTDTGKVLLKDKIATLSHDRVKKLKALHAKWNAKRSAEQVRNYKTFQQYFTECGIVFNTALNINHRRSESESSLSDSPKTDPAPSQRSISFETVNILKEVYTDDQISEANQGGFNEAKFKTVFNAEWAKFGKAQDKKKIAVTTAFMAATENDGE